MRRTRAACHRCVPGLCAVWLSVTASATAQSSEELTLARAREIALANNPRVLSATLEADAAATVTLQAQSAYWPTLTANVTSVGAQLNSAVASGAVTTSSLSSRLAGGVVANQLVTDFGRTGNLVRAARLRADAQRRRLGDVRAHIVLEVVQSYYDALAAEAVLATATADLENRRVLLRRVAALAESDLKSTLDVSFAEVALSEAELTRVRAESTVAEARATLAAALGSPEVRPYSLVDEPLPAEGMADVDALIAQALAARPDVAAARLRRDAAISSATAERALSFPALNATFVAGAIPTHDERLRDSYRGAGLNISLPMFNGGLFAARRTEAHLHAQSAAQELEQLNIAAARDVRVAWHQATTAFKRLDVTARLVAQTARSLTLARARYELGLTGIVEVNQAQVNDTSAQVAAATAKYEYLARRAALDYAIGILQ